MEQKSSVKSYNTVSAHVVPWRSRFEVGWRIWLEGQVGAVGHGHWHSRWVECPAELAAVSFSDAFPVCAPAAKASVPPLLTGRQTSAPEIQ